MHLQFLESGLGDEMVNGLVEGWMRFRVLWTLDLLRA